MFPRVSMRRLEAFENPRFVPLSSSLFGASFFLMKLLPARFMLERAAEDGRLQPGTTICESSSGTFGLALAMLAVQNNYKLLLVSDWALDQHLRHRLVDLGVQLDIVEEPHLEGGFQQARLERLEAHLDALPDSYWPAQYSNPDNPLSYSRVAEQIIDRVGEVDCLIGAVGSGGSICGTARHLRTLFPEITVIGVDTHNSVLFGQPNAKRYISGLGGSIVPENVDHTQFNEVHWLSAAEAIQATHQLFREHGLFMGPTSGAAYKVANWWSLSNPGKRAVVFFPDEGHRYMETAYNQAWVQTVPGWPARHKQEPSSVRSPHDRMDGWSRFAWNRRTLDHLLSNPAGLAAEQISNAHQVT